MREFNKVPGRYWMSSTIKQLKQYGPEAMLLAIYLQTNHHTHSFGVFYLPIEYIAHDIGASSDKVAKLLKILCQLDFCRYDFSNEYIWIKDYALEQAGGPLREGDNRIIQLQKYAEALPRLSFLDEFYNTHKEDFHLSVPLKGLQSPFEAPSEPLRSTETETETKTETKTEKETETENYVAQARRPETDKPEQAVFEHWKKTMDHPKAVLDSNRRRLIQKAMKMGYGKEQLCQAISGCSKTPHNMGANENNQRYDGLHVILRNADQIDRFIRNHHEPPRHASKDVQKANVTYLAMKNWIQNKEEVAHAIV